MSEKTQMKMKRKNSLFSFLDREKKRKECIIFGLKKDRKIKVDSKAGKVLKNKLQTSLINIIMLLTIFSCFVVECDERNLQEVQSYIILKTKGTGYIQIIERSFSPMPDKVYINGNNELIGLSPYLITDSGDNININTFKFVWNQRITSAYRIFIFF